MSEKRFILCQDDLGNYEIRDDDKVFHFLWEVAPILNEQQELLEKRERQLRKAMVYLVSDTCSLSEAKLGEVIEEIKNA